MGISALPVGVFEGENGGPEKIWFQQIYTNVYVWFIACLFLFTLPNSPSVSFSVLANIAFCFLYKSSFYLFTTQLILIFFHFPSFPF